MKRIVIALGGNAFLRKNQKGFFREQVENLKLSLKSLVSILNTYEVVLTHGNGPQVGNIYLQQELLARFVPPMPLDACDAMSQGLIGYMLLQALNSIPLNKPVVVLVTRVLVNLNDPAFKKPTKPIGPYYSEKEAKRLERERKWTFIKTPEGMFRRVVPSPKPVKILDTKPIKELIEKGFLVVACGGGGIPVAFENNSLRGVEAVIDKDLTAALLASSIEADTLIILTNVDYVYLNYATPSQKPLRKMSLREAEKYYREGHFPPGSMGPK
ncbi:MAG TPA: carbamate kinase, partial [Thermoproteales archaeon]|nr:carbamate kinase [Thermoproteales archaeon]